MEYIEAIKSTMTSLFAMALLTQFAAVFSGEEFEKNGIAVISGLIAGIYILKLCLELIGRM